MGARHPRLEVIQGAARDVFAVLEHAAPDRGFAGDARAAGRGREGFEGDHALVFGGHKRPEDGRKVDAPRIEITTVVFVDVEIAETRTTGADRRRGVRLLDMHVESVEMNADIVLSHRVDEAEGLG